MRHLDPHVRSAIEPLLLLARELPFDERRRYLNDLRNDAPALVRVLESELQQS